MDPKTKKNDDRFRLKNESPLGILPGLPWDRPGRLGVPPGGLALTPGQVNLKIVLRFHHLDPAGQEALVPDALQREPGGANDRPTKVPL